MVLDPAEDLDVVGHGGGRSRGRLPGVLRPRRPRDGPQGMGRGPRRGARPPRARRILPRAAVHGASGGAAADAGAAEPGRPEVLETWLAARRGDRVASRCRSAAPKRKLMEWWRSNASEAFHRHKLRRASDFGARSRALARARRPARPRAGAAADRVLRHLEPRPDGQGGLDGGVRGRPARSARTTGASRSRTWRDRTISPPWRRCSGGGSPGSSRSADEPPGGDAAAVRVPAGADRGRRRPRPARRGRRGARATAGCDIPAIGLAKRLEEVYFPGQPDPLVIPRGSEALFVLQHIRDEAHRFAVTYHRQKRAKRALRVAARRDPWRGPARKKALLKRFGSLTRLRDAEPSTRSRRRPGIGPELARADPRPAARAATAARGGRAPDGRARDPATPPAPSRAGARLHDHHGALGRRPLRGGASASRTSATSSSTTCRRRSSARWPSSPRARAARRAWRSWPTPAAGCSSASCRRRSRSCEQLRIPYRILFLEASDDDLVNRYEATRRRHPLAPADRVVEGIRKERLMMESLRGEADLVIDTSDLTPARPPRPDPRAVRRRAARGRPAGVAGLVRLQVRGPARRRHGPRRPVPAQPATGCRRSGRCRAPTPQVRRTSRASRCTVSSCDRLGGAARRHRPRLRRRGEGLPDDRGRLHRRPPPLGRGRRRAGASTSASAACR